MDEKFLLLLMIFCHIVDDFYLQGILASMKQKDWWKANYPQELYKSDYIIALITHSFSWTFMIMLPMVAYYRFKISKLFIFVFALNMILHSITDDRKANKKTINLWEDQIIHLWQIVTTFATMILARY